MKGGKGGWGGREGLGNKRETGKKGRKVERRKKGGKGKEERRTCGVGLRRGREIGEEEERRGERKTGG